MIEPLVNGPARKILGDVKMLQKMQESTPEKNQESASEK